MQPKAAACERTKIQIDHTERVSSHHAFSAKFSPSMDVRTDHRKVASFFSTHMLLYALWGFALSSTNNYNRSTWMLSHQCESVRAELARSSTIENSHFKPTYERFPSSIYCMSLWPTFWSYFTAELLCFDTAFISSMTWWLNWTRMHEWNASVDCSSLSSWSGVSQWPYKLSTRWRTEAYGLLVPLYKSRFKCEINLCWFRLPCRASKGKGFAVNVFFSGMYKRCRCSVNMFSTFYMYMLGIFLGSNVKYCCSYTWVLDQNFVPNHFILAKPVQARE